MPPKRRRRTESAPLFLNCFRHDRRLGAAIAGDKTRRFHRFGARVLADTFGNRLRDNSVVDGAERILKIGQRLILPVGCVFV